MSNPTLTAGEAALAAIDVTRPEMRATAVVLQLLDDPRTLRFAIRGLKQHGIAFVAFLVGDVSAAELDDPSSLDEAFRARHLATFASLATARQRTVELLAKAVDARCDEDAKFKEAFESDAEGFFRGFGSSLRFVVLGEHVFVFGHRDSR